MEHSIEYIFTYPGGWAEPQYLYFRAIERACLVPSTPEGHLRIHMLTEGEAGFHFYASYFLKGTVGQVAPQGVIIIDAGGANVGSSAFSVTSNPVFCEEIAPAECMQLSPIANFLLIHPYIL